MPFTQIASKFYRPKKPASALLIEALVVSFFGFIIAKEFLPDLWNKYMNVCHTAIELACVFIALATFFTVWYTYKRNPPVNHLIGFGFFLIAVFLILHTCYSFNLQANSNQYLNLSIGFLILISLQKPHQIRR